MSKGSNRRPGEGYEEGYDRIFNKIDAQIKEVEALLQRKRDRRQEQVPVEVDRRCGNDRRKGSQDV